MNREVNSTLVHPDQLVLTRQFTSVRLIGPPMSEMIHAHDKPAVLKVCQCRQSHAFSDHDCRRSDIADGCLIG